MTPIASQPPPKLPHWLEQFDAVRPSMASTSIGTEIAHSVGACPHGAFEHLTEREPTEFCHSGTSENSHALPLGETGDHRGGGGRGVRRRLKDALPDSDERELMEPPQVSPGSARAQVADVLGLGPRAVRDYVARGELSGRLIRGRWRFGRKDIEEFLAMPPKWELR